MNRRILTASVPMLAFLLAIPTAPVLAQSPEIRFDHNHTFGEVVDYLEALSERFPALTVLHNIGKSYQGRDLLVLEITNQETGDGLSKPGFWMDGNLHAGDDP